MRALRLTLITAGLAIFAHAQAPSVGSIIRSSPIIKGDVGYNPLFDFDNYVDVPWEVSMTSTGSPFLG